MIKRSIITLIIALLFTVSCGRDEQSIVSIPSTAEPSPTVPTATETTLPALKPSETPTAVSPSSTPTSTASPTATATIMPTETAVFFNPTFSDFEPFEDLPGLLSRSGGTISALAGNGDIIWAQIGRELVGLNMLDQSGSETVGRMVLPFYAKRLYIFEEFIVAQSDKLFVINVSDPTAPKGEYIISGLGDFSIRQTDEGELFIKDEGNQWWRFYPGEAQEVRFLIAHEFLQPASTVADEPWFNIAYPSSAFISQLGDVENRLFVLVAEGPPVLVGETVYFWMPTLTSNVLVAADTSNQDNLKVLNVYEPFNTNLVDYFEGQLVTGYVNSDGPAAVLLVNVENPEMPELMGLMPSGTRPYDINGRQLIVGDHPGISIFDVDNLPNALIVDTVESPRAERQIANQLIVLAHPSRDLAFLVNGTYIGEEKNIELVELQPELKFVSQIGTEQIFAISAYEDTLYVLEADRLRLFDIQNQAEPKEMEGYLFWEEGQPPVKVLSMTNPYVDENGRFILPILTNAQTLLLDITIPGGIVERGHYNIPKTCDRNGRFTLQQVDSLMYLHFPQCPIQQIDVANSDAPALLNELPISARFLIADGLLFAENLGRLEIYDLATLLNE